jgi:hypothetical protein
MMGKLSSERLDNMYFEWKSKDEVPPLGKEAIAAGNTDGGWSIPLIHKHKSGAISMGRALIHEGKVTHWYPGEIGDYMHCPESDKSEDPIVGWFECPTAANVVEAFEALDSEGLGVSGNWFKPFKS